MTTQFGAIDGRLNVIDFCLCNSWQACLDVSLELGVLVKNIRTCIWMHSKPNGHQYVDCILLLCSSWLRPRKHPQAKHTHQYNQRCAQYVQKTAIKNQKSAMLTAPGPCTQCYVQAQQCQKAPQGEQSGCKTSTTNHFHQKNM